MAAAVTIFENQKSYLKLFCFEDIACKLFESFANAELINAYLLLLTQKSQETRGSILRVFFANLVYDCILP